LKSQFISQYDMLEVKERELVRQDGKVSHPHTTCNMQHTPACFVSSLLLAL